MTTAPVPSITDELLNQLEQSVKNDLSNEDFQGDGRVIVYGIAALITRLRDSERDAARYRFARLLENDCFMLNTLQVFSGSELDAAIDQAMTEELTE